MEVLSCRVSKTRSLLVEKLCKKYSLSHTIILNRCLEKFLETIDDKDEEIKMLLELDQAENDFYIATERIKMQLKKSSLVSNAKKLLTEMKQKGISAQDRVEMKRLILERIKKMYGVDSEEYQGLLNDKSRRD